MIMPIKVLYQKNVVCHDKGENFFRSDNTDRGKRDGFQVTWQAPASEQTIVTGPHRRISSILLNATHRPKVSSFYINETS